MATEFEGLAAQFAAAKKAQESQLLSGRSRDASIKHRNLLARRDFRFAHGLLVVLLLAFFYLHVVGLYLFTRGFLLTRLVLEHKSTCDVSPLGPGLATGDVDAGCWHPKTFDKAVVVIIDALRYDFTVPYEGEGEKEFHNALTTPYRIAKEHPENAILTQFIADPPTTTLQRLKGLTTGTLPTFIDAGSNFAGTAIDEDNLIAQFKTLGKRMAFMGDDTWMALFPGLFEKDMEWPYESLNVWDLHTVDRGVNEHIFPLLKGANQTRWDVLFGHYLGVDHAGHRYGPDHPAMREKLEEMDGVVKELVERMDEDTLLVVMGDHGMDPKGDHGGESRGEVEAALWMYSKRPVFGRFAGDKVREVNQIDLVSTLALLLGIPIPFNNLGAPIAEAFLGSGDANGWRNLAQVSRLTAAQIRRYQRDYAGTKDDPQDDEGAAESATWKAGEQTWRTAEAVADADADALTERWRLAYKGFAEYQKETLRVCKNLWARFDLISMGAGVLVLVGSVAVVAIYARGFTGDRQELTDTLLKRLRDGLSIGTILALPLAKYVADHLQLPKLHIILFGTALGIIGGFISASVYARRRLASLLPNSGWGFLSLLITILHSLMFGSNSFTIWEHKIVSFFLGTFALASFIASQRNDNALPRMLGVYHSLWFLVLTRVASFSRLCREEQMPHCKSTFYASDTSSVSAPWTLGLLFLMAIFLPNIIASFYTKTLSYEGPAPFYISWAFRLGLSLTAAYWFLDSADNASWLPRYDALLKSVKPMFAQIVLAIGLVAGHVGFAWSSLCLDVVVRETKPLSNTSIPKSEEGKTLTSTPTRSVVLLGYANIHGSRFFLLPLCWSLVLILLQKPLGGLSLGIQLWQILILCELVDINSLASTPIAPVVLALLGNAHYFSTGHQATLSSIQWESAFIPLTTIRYPWSPLLVTANTLGAQILSAVALPLLAIWKAEPKERVLGRTAVMVATYMLFQSVLGTATVVCAGHLRRHLMLYRIFSPRYMLASVVLVVGELIAIVVGFGGVRWNAEAVGEVFGFA